MQTRVTLTLRMVAGLNRHNKQIRELTGPLGCRSDGHRTSSSVRVSRLADQVALHIAGDVRAGKAHRRSRSVVLAGWVAVRG
jgi:hypothetical protein